MTKAQRAAAFRARNPAIAAFVDEHRAIFGDVRVTWLRDEHDEIGTRGEPGIVPTVYAPLPEASERPTGDDRGAAGTGVATRGKRRRSGPEIAATSETTP